MRFGHMFFRGNVDVKIRKKQIGKTVGKNAGKTREKKSSIVFNIPGKICKTLNSKFPCFSRIFRQGKNHDFSSRFRHHFYRKFSEDVVASLFSFSRVCRLGEFCNSLAMLLQSEGPPEALQSDWKSFDWTAITEPCPMLISCMRRRLSIMHRQTQSLSISFVPASRPTNFIHSFLHVACSETHWEKHAEGILREKKTRNANKKRKNCLKNSMLVILTTCSIKASKSMLR